MATQETQQQLNQQLEEQQARLREALEEAVRATHEMYHKQIDDLREQVADLESKLRLQVDAETNVEIRKLAGRENISVEAWLEREIQIAVRYADAPMIRVQQVFYDRLKALARARGTLPESLTLSTETTQRFMSLIDNLLI